MAELFSTEESLERVILIAVADGEQDEAERSLDELEDLIRTDGAETVGRLIQRREKPDNGTYFGKGKIDELRALVFETDATGVVADDELSPAQMKNLKEALDLKVMDRTMVILDIFARHAVTAEGKLQVELAQLRYRSAHLEGIRASLSRLGGGIGTRGPGEQKLEMDRRLIRERISFLRERLEELLKHREVTRKSRERQGAFVVSVVGDTNAGKSTLFNRLTDASILAEDKLFATLDPTTRKLTLEGGQEVLLTDTVGFIRKLPHHLIEAFRSTLEETRYADLLLHVVDASNPEADTQMAVVRRTLQDLNALEDRELITVYNKTDLTVPDRLPRDPGASGSVRVSALTGAGMEELLSLIAEAAGKKRRYLEKCFPYSEAGQIQLIRQKGQLLSEEYTENGILVRANVPADLYGRFGSGAEESARKAED